MEKTQGITMDLQYDYYIRWPDIIKKGIPIL
jgi:hypothetical protein